jgi:hypothetical protein
MTTPVYNYTLDTFLAIPTATDTKLRIYDKNNVLKYTLSPDLTYFYVKNNIVVIKQENVADIKLNFIDSQTAILALDKLNNAKKVLSQHPISSNIEYTFSIDNLNMAGTLSGTTNNGDLACDSPIGNYPISNVRVFVNGIEVNVGPNLDCYFSPDGGITKRDVSTAKYGDFLYWNGGVAGYQIDHIDSIDFVYLVQKKQTV